MSRHRRRQNRSRQPGNGANAAASGNGAQAGTNANANRSGAARSGRRDRRARTAVDVFWGDPDTAPQTVERIRPTTDPAAVPRSLGEPPLTPDTAAPHHLAVVYEEAVRAATALAAANGLLGDGPAGGDGDEPTG